MAGILVAIGVCLVTVVVGGTILIVIEGLRR